MFHVNLPGCREASVEEKATKVLFISFSDECFAGCLAPDHWTRRFVFKKQFPTSHMTDGGCMAWPAPTWATFFWMSWLDCFVILFSVKWFCTLFTFLLFFVSHLMSLRWMVFRDGAAADDDDDELCWLRWMVVTVMMMTTVHPNPSNSIDPNQGRAKNWAFVQNRASVMSVFLLFWIAHVRNEKKSVVWGYTGD